MAKTLCTIGFGQKSLERFIQMLQAAGVTKVIDIRLHNTSQLAGYAKKDDLAFILKAFGIEYEHVLELAPTEELMQEMRKGGKEWGAREAAFNRLMTERRVENLWTSPVFDSAVNCLLCAEPTAKHCHRRLVAEYLQGAHPEIAIKHLE